MGYRLSIEKNPELLSIRFHPVDPSSHWARIFFPACIVYGLVGTYCKLGESQEVILTKDTFRISKFRGARRISAVECKPWFITNVRYRKGGRNTPSSITYEVEARFRRFADGITYSDAYSLLNSVLDSGFLPNSEEVHVP